MNFKLIRDGNAFYEIDEQCMNKKEQKNANIKNSNSINNTTSRKQNNMFSYKPKI